MTSPLRVMHVLDSLAGGGVAGLEVTFADVARQRPLDLSVVAFFPPPAGVVGQAGVLESFGVDVHQLALPHGVLRRRVTPFSELTALVRRLRPDVIRTALSTGNIVGTAIGRLTRTPVVATLHATLDETERHPPRMRLAETAALRWGASRVVAVGESVAESHRPRLGRPIDVVPNAVRPTPALSPEERRRTRQRLTGDADRPFVLSVGRLVPQKGLPDLVEAFAGLVRQLPDAVLVVAGGGPLEEELPRLVSAAGMTNRVVLLGNTSEVPQLLGAADVFVSSSHWEGLPLAVLEAMAAGLPVVATAVGENARLLDHGRGVVVPPHAPEALRDGLHQVLVHREKAQRNARAAAAYVAHVHGAERWVDHLVALYEDVAARGRVGSPGGPTCAA